MNTPLRIYPNRDVAKARYADLVTQYVEDKYHSEEYIECQFDIYMINPEDNTLIRKVTTYCPTKEGLIHLLTALLTYPDITFQDMPIYIPLEVYDHMLNGLKFPRHEHISHWRIGARHHLPVAVEMATLQKLAQEIAGEEMCSFELQLSNSKYRKEAIVSIECHRMDIQVIQAYEDAPKFDTYCQVDLNRVKELLNVSNNMELRYALCAMSKAHASDTEDVAWIVAWLDENNLKYEHVNRLV